MIRPLREQIQALIGNATLREIERELYWAAWWYYLKAEAVAESLGVTKQTAYNKAEEYQIPIEEWRTIRMRQSRIFPSKL